MGSLRSMDFRGKVNLPANWFDDLYWSATQSSSNTHDYVRLNTDVPFSGGADSFFGYVAFQVL